MKPSPQFFLIFFLALAVAATTPPPPPSPQCKAWLVQSIPTDMPLLARVPGVLSTGEVLRWLAGNSTKRLDIVAQYWQLLAQPENPKSGDYGFSVEEMERFGAGEGRAVYKSLEDAADRKIDIRIIQHSGFSPDFDQESANLALGRPNVKNVTLLLGDWWGSGIVHAKVWISDGKDMYIGSANNDWKSLTQVKEVGIYLVGCYSIARWLEIYFNNLWKLSSLNSTYYTKTVWDKQWQAKRKVPCWSHFIHEKNRCRSPLPPSVEIHHVEGYPALSDPYMFHIPIETPGSNLSSRSHHSSYLSFAPPEARLIGKPGTTETDCQNAVAAINNDCSSIPKHLQPILMEIKFMRANRELPLIKAHLSFRKFQADEQGWVETIKSVRFGGIVRINTMDWLGQSQYLAQTVYWSSLSSAISEVIFSKRATVNIIVAYWSHFIENTDQYLKALLYSNVLCQSSKRNYCRGKVNIKYYKVPGYQKTGAARTKTNATGNLYPGFTRVNHGKYAVSDVRAHIGTSNLIWDYFYTTAGVSFGTYHPAIVAQLQEIFDADWNSPYAVPVEQLRSSS